MKSKIELSKRKEKDKNNSYSWFSFITNQSMRGSLIDNKQVAKQKIGKEPLATHTYY
jgi:hypothetical protein